MSEEVKPTSDTPTKPEDDAIKHYRNKQRNDKKKIFDGIRSQEVLLTIEEIQNSEFDPTMKSKKLSAGTAEMQGRRKTMEDADTNIVYFRGTEDESFFGVRKTRNYFFFIFYL